MVNLEEKRNLAYLKRTLNIPSNADANQYCKLYLDNLVGKQVDEEMQKEMTDVLGNKKKKSISEDYDLGVW